MSCTASNGFSLRSDGGSGRAEAAYFKPLTSSAQVSVIQAVA
jgi:hypothetical protein